MSSQKSFLRIDRWLFYCRFYKTRVLSTAAVSAGHVKLNGERATPGARVKAGDQIHLVRDQLPYSFSVIEIPSRRGPAKEAQDCYAQDEAITSLRAAMTTSLRQDRMTMPRTSGKPDKHTRRKLRARNRD